MSCSIARLRSRPASPCSAPNATSTCAGRRSRPIAWAMSVVGASSRCHDCVVLRPLPVGRRGCAVVGDGGGHHDHVRVSAGHRLTLEVAGRRRRDDVHAGRRARADIRCEKRHVSASPPCFVREGDPHASRRAIADVSDRVDRLACAARRDDHVPACERRRLPEQGRRTIDDLRRLGHPADAHLTLRQLAGGGPDDLDPTSAQQRLVRLGRRMVPHARVHRRRDEHRAVVGQDGLGEHVVGEAVREARHRVGRQRRDDDQVGALKVGIRAGGLFAPRESMERLGRDESLGPARRQREDVMPRTDEQPDDLACLVGSDAAGDPEDDPRHGSSVPVAARMTERRRAGLLGVRVGDFRLRDLFHRHRQVVLRPRLDQAAAAPRRSPCPHRAGGDSC